MAANKKSKRSWACVGHKLGREHRSWIEPGSFDTTNLQQRNEEAAKMYETWTPEWEAYQVDDAEVVLTGELQKQWWTNCAWRGKRQV